MSTNSEHVGNVSYTKRKDATRRAFGMWVSIGSRDVFYFIDMVSPRCGKICRKILRLVPRGALTDRDIPTQSVPSVSHSSVSTNSKYVGNVSYTKRKDARGCAFGMWVSVGSRDVFHFTDMESLSCGKTRQKILRLDREEHEQIVTFLPRMFQACLIRTWRQVPKT